MTPSVKKIEFFLIAHVFPVKKIEFLLIVHVSRLSVEQLISSYAEILALSSQAGNTANNIAEIGRVASQQIRFAIDRFGSKCALAASSDTGANP